MAKKSHIDVKVSVESIRDSLRKLIVSVHSNLITDVIIGNLDKTDVGFDQLYKALSGVQELPKFKVGDHVMIKVTSLYTWQFDQAKTEDAGLTLQGRIKCLIIDIDPYKKDPYEVSYKAIKVVGGVDTETDLKSQVQENTMCLEEEWPTESNNDLPF